MFWGCFSGAGKGLGIFWEEDWAHITSETYWERIIPVVHGWIQLCEREGKHDTFMQDNAPGHAAATMLAGLEERGIRVVRWPPFSPDLNLIETVWSWMKDYIAKYYGHVEKPSYNVLRSWVKEAWEAVPEEWLQELLAGMSQRFRKVYLADGGHIY